MVEVADLRRELQNQSELWPFKVKDVPTFAFITGPLRDRWEALESADAKLALQRYVSLAFESRLGNDGERAVRVHVGAPAAQIPQCACPICAGHKPQKFLLRPISELLSDTKSEDANLFLGSKEEAQIEFDGVEKLYDQLDGQPHILSLEIILLASC